MKAKLWGMGSKQHLFRKIKNALQLYSAVISGGVPPCYNDATMRYYNDAVMQCSNTVRLYSYNDAVVPSDRVGWEHWSC
jgi:hypothetical protein